MVTNKDRFELPNVKKSYNIDIIFNEDEISYMQWEDSGAKSGIVKLKGGENNQYFVQTFYDLKNNICVENVWGGYVNKQKDDFIREIYSLYEIRRENNERVNSTAAYDKQYLEGCYGADPYLTNIAGRRRMAINEFKTSEKSDLGKSWTKPRRDKNILIRPEYHLIVTE